MPILLTLLNQFNKIIHTEISHYNFLDLDTFCCNLLHFIIYVCYD